MTDLLTAVEYMLLRLGYGEDSHRISVECVFGEKRKLGSLTLLALKSVPAAVLPAACHRSRAAGRAPLAAASCACPRLWQATVSPARSHAIVAALAAAHALSKESFDWRADPTHRKRLMTQVRAVAACLSQSADSVVAPLHASVAPSVTAAGGDARALAA